MTQAIQRKVAEAQSIRHFVENHPRNSMHVDLLWITPSTYLLLMIGCFVPVGSKGTDKAAMTSVLSPRSSFNETIQALNATKGRNVVIVSTIWKNEDICGVATAKILGANARIVGGTTAKRGQWPWMAMLWKYYWESNDFTFSCGGSVIKKQWVLTAAHCFNGWPIEYTHVVLGAHRRDMTDPSARRFAIADYICHNLYVGPMDTYAHDICLVKLAGEVEYSDFILPICLPSIEQKITDGDTCKIAGWGETQGTGNNQELQTATIQVLNKEKCKEGFKNYASLPDDHFCAGQMEGKIDSCQGDSGGPLVAVKRIGKRSVTVQFGIVSFGIGCAQPNLPGVYTMVSKYTDWVASTIASYTGPEDCFDATHLVQCNSKISRSETVIRTPVIDQTTWMYPPNTDCSWYIEAPEGCAISLAFQCFFHAEINADNASQCYDYVKIVSAEADISLVYCKAMMPNNILIGSNRVTVSFHSDESVQSSGFVFRPIFIEPRSGRSGHKNTNSTSANETVSPLNGTLSVITIDSQTPVRVSTKECTSNCNFARSFSNCRCFIWLSVLSHYVFYRSLALF